MTIVNSLPKVNSIARQVLLMDDLRAGNLPWYETYEEATSYYIRSGDGNIDSQKTDPLRVMFPLFDIASDTDNDALTPVQQIAEKEDILLVKLLVAMVSVENTINTKSLDNDVMTKAFACIDCYCGVGYIIMDEYLCDARENWFNKEIIRTKACPPNTVFVVAISEYLGVMAIRDYFSLDSQLMECISMGTPASYCTVARINLN